MRERQPHVLERTSSEDRPRRIVFFDTETRWQTTDDKVTRHELRLGFARLCELTPAGALKPKRELSFTTSGEFIDWLDAMCKPKSTVHLVAHNLPFDLSVVGAFVRLAQLGWKLQSFYTKGMVSIFRWQHGERRILGLDNGNFFGGKLADWGELVGLPKLEIDLQDATDAELEPYCRRDVEVLQRLWELWLGFLDEHQCGSFKPTVSSTAFNTWRHRFMADKVHIHVVERALQLERDAYSGGRAECLWVGRREDGPYYYLDVNNMYGWVLSTCEMPTGIWGSSVDIDPWRLAYKLERYAVIARVTIAPTEPWFPQKQGIFTFYPVGLFSAVLTTPELKLAVDRGWLVDVESCAWYSKAVLFGEYTQEFTRQRRRYERDGNQGMARICKLLVNGLYGKFGQRGLSIERVGDCDPTDVRAEEVYDAETGEHFRQIWLGGGIWRERKTGESWNSFPGIAAHVTAYARLRLYELLRRVPQGHAFYMDTDSLIVDQVGYDALSKLVNPQQLGMLKVELSSDWLEIHAPKDYAMAGREKRKGIRADALQLGPATFQQTSWLKLPGLIQAGVTEGYLTKETRKTLRREVHSGTVRPDGWIAPFQVHSVGWQEGYQPEIPF